MPLLRRFRQIDAFNNGLDKLVIQVDPATDFNAEAMIPVDVTGTPLGSATNPMVTTGAGVGGGAAATATAAPPTFTEGQSVPLSVDLSGNLRTAGGGGTSSTVDVTDRSARLVGHVTVDNLPATQPVSGTVNLGNFPATQPISAASLPLPTGAATESSLGTDGAAPPTIPGSGVRGWLRSIYDLLAGTLTTNVSDRAARLLGHVTVDNFPASQAVTGPLTDTQLRASVVPVDVTPASPAANDYLPVRLTDGVAFYAATGGSGGGGAVTVADGADVAQGTTTDAAWTSGAGTVVGLLKAVVGAILGTLTVNVTDRAARLLGHVTVDNASLAVTGTFWQTTQPVSGSVTNQQSNVTADYDSGAGTQNLTMFGVALPASGGAVSGGTSTNPIRTDPTGTTTQPVSGTFWQATQPVSGTVTANVGTTNGLALDASVGTTNTEIGGLTEAAPASDTASSGLNGRLQRIAQRLTSLIAQLPATLGQKTMANSLGVTLASDQSAVPVSGTFWQATQPVSGTVTSNQGTANTAANAWPAKVTDGTNTAAVKAASTAAAATDPAIVVAQSPNSPIPAGTNRIGSVRPVDSSDVDLTSVKGTQTARFVGVQSAHDAGRTQVLAAWEEMTGTAAVESALTNFTFAYKNVGSLTAADHITVTSGKTLRIQAVNIYVKNTSTTAVLARFRIRQGTSILNTSSIIWNAVIGIESPTFASGEAEAQSYSIAEGIEVASLQMVTFTWLTSVTTCTVGMTIVGYEY